MPNLRFNHAGFTLASHLFRQFLAENDIDTAAAEYVSIRRFYRWAQERKEENPAADQPLFPDKDKLQEVYDIDDDTFEFISDLLEDPFEACAHLYSWWPLLCMSCRPPLKSKVLAINVTYSVRFEDGRIALFPMPLGQQSEPYTDGMILTLWRGQLAMMTHMLRNTGLNDIYDKITAEGLQHAVLEVDVDEDVESDIGLCAESDSEDDVDLDSEDDE